jgi:DNA-binding transcriptional LysR family regulator
MNQNFHQLTIFATVVDTQGITAAAKKLCMTQPAVSIQMKQLEAHYGLKLIEVIGKKIYVTAAGHKLYQTYQRVKHELSNLDMEFSELQGGLKGSLDLSIVSTAKYFIPQFLGKFHQLYPHINIRLRVMNRNEIIKRLENNLDDMVIMSQPSNSLPIVKEVLLEDELVICAPYNHPLTKRNRVSLHELESEPFIIRELGSGTRMVMERLFHQYQIKPNVVMEFGSSSAIKQTIIAGFGLSCLSKMSIQAELSLKQLAILNIKELPIKHPWYLVMLKGKSISPAAKSFLDFLGHQNMPKC